MPRGIACLSSKLGCKRLHLLPQSPWDDESTRPGPTSITSYLYPGPPGPFFLPSPCRAKLNWKPPGAKCFPATKLLHQLPAIALVLDASSGLLKAKHLRPRSPPNPPLAKTQLCTATLSPSFLPPPSCLPTFSPTACRAQNRSQAFSDLGSKSCSVMSDSMRPPWTVAHHTPFLCPWNSSGKNTGVGSQPFPSPGDLPDPGIKPGSLALQADSLPFEPPEKPNLGREGSYFQNVGLLGTSLVVQ